VWVVKGSGGGGGEKRVSSSVRSRSGGMTATTTTIPYQPQVCSHQLLNPPALSTSKNNKSPVDGSLEAMEAFWRSTPGIKCYDIDVVTLQDGTLMASHPNRLSTALSTTRGNTQQQDEEEVHGYTLEKIQSLLGKEETRRSFPLLDQDLLPYYARLIKGSEPCFYGGVDDGSNAQRSLHGPLLNLDLKQGPYLTKERLLQIVDTILELEIENNIAICVTPLSEEEKQQQQQQQQQQNNHYLLDMLSILHEYNMQQKQSNNRIIPLGLVLRDLIQVDQDTARVQNLIRQYDSIKLLVPSYKFSEPWYQQIYSVFPSLPITVWTIDTQSEYQYSKSMNVSAIIANRPMDF
jgi:hypothetical protein